MRLNIGIPIVEEKIHLQFFLSFLQMEMPDYTLLVPQWPSGHMAENIATARNSLVRQALANGASHLIMCDTDQIYPADCVKKLLFHEKDVVGVRVHRRHPPFELILNRGELSKYTHVPDEEGFSGDLIEVDSTGCGCMLFNMDIFKNMPEPWFYLDAGPTGKPVGEDIRFCHNARRAGYKIYVDTSIEVGHMTTMVINRAFYELYKKVTGYEWTSEKEKNDE